MKALVGGMKLSFVAPGDKNRNLLTFTMNPLRAQVIARIDALIDRDVGTLTPELSCLTDLRSGDEPFVDLDVDNNAGGPPILVWRLPLSVFDVLVGLFAEGRYSVKAMDTQTGALLACTCPTILNMPILSDEASTRSSMQHWMVMSLHRGVVNGGGHWVWGDGGATFGFHWAPDADCDVCAGVAPS